MSKFKIEKKQVTRYTLQLECCECGISDELIIGFDFLNRDQALRQVPVEEWNGWNISNRDKPLCPGCRVKSRKKGRM